MTESPTRLPAEALTRLEGCSDWLRKEADRSQNAGWVTVKIAGEIAALRHWAASLDELKFLAANAPVAALTDEQLDEMARAHFARFAVEKFLPPLVRHKFFTDSYEDPLTGHLWTAYREAYKLGFKDAAANAPVAQTENEFLYEALMVRHINNDGSDPRRALNAIIEWEIATAKDSGRLDAPVAQPAGVVAWRCFHCDESFSDVDAAREHFGSNEMQEPICQIDAAKFRETEAALQRYLNEDTDLHREIHRLHANHAVAHVREEEKGYAKGLADGRALAAPTRSSEPVGAVLGYVYTVASVSRPHDPVKRFSEKLLARETVGGVILDITPVVAAPKLTPKS